MRRSGVRTLSQGAGSRGSTEAGVKFLTHLPIPAVNFLTPFPQQLAPARVTAGWHGFCFVLSERPEPEMLA